VSDNHTHVYSVVFCLDERKCFLFLSTRVDYDKYITNDDVLYSMYNVLVEALKDDLVKSL